MSGGRRAARNTAALIASRLVSAVFSAALVVYAARRLGDAGFGSYSFILVFVSYFYAVATLGMRDLIVRDVSREKEKAGAYIGTASALSAVGGAVSAVLILAASRWIRGAEGIRAPLAIAAVSVLPTALYSPFDAIFRAYERMDYSASLEALWNAGRVVGGIAALASGGGLTALLLVFCLAEAGKALHACAWCSRAFPTGGWTFDPSLMSYLAWRSFPLMIWGLVGIIYYKVDIIMLMQMRGPGEVGWYSAPYRVIDLLTMCALFAAQAALPLLSEYHHRGGDLFPSLARRLLAWFVSAYLAAACLLTVFAAPLVAAVYGPGYAPSVPVLRVLGWSSVLVATSYLFGNILMAMDRYVFAVKAAVLTTALNVVFNLVLIPRHGAAGAALATLIGEIATFAVLYAYIAGRGAAGFSWRLLCAVLAASAAAAAASWGALALRLAPLPAGAMAAGCCAATAWAAGLVRAGDIAQLRRIARP